MFKCLPVMLILAVALSACSRFDREPMPSGDYSPVMPVAMESAAAPGTIYSPFAGLSLFTDLRARTIGDILIVTLEERTDASKESSASSARGTDIDTGAPTIAGRTITQGGNPVLSTSIQSDASFSGGADASQSNSLNGNIAVTVSDRLANGNLLVRGEKWITLNHGEEFIQLSGIIRPIDIAPDNSIPSTKIANARITYSGKGNLANSSRPGWLARFFTSPIFPF
jgi:flagellar L-ring protein precursor FlgH